MTADNTQVGILKCKIDECLTTEEVNNCFIQLSGYSIGDKYSYFQNYLIKFDYPKDLPVLYTLRSAISQGKTCTAAKFRIPDKDSCRYRLLSLTQFDENKNPHSVIVILFDIDGEMQLIAICTPRLNRRP